MGCEPNRCKQNDSKKGAHLDGPPVGWLDPDGSCETLTRFIDLPEILWMLEHVTFKIELPV